MENQNNVFTDNSVDSIDKLEDRCEQSIYSHIKRIRFANEKRKTEYDRSHYGLPKISNNGSSNTTSKKIIKHKNVQDKTELNEPRFGDDNGNRFLTPHINNPSYGYSENSGDTGHRAEDKTNTQGGIHEISTSHFIDNSVDFTDKLEQRREQSIFNHIKRIRFANEKWKTEYDRSHYAVPKISNNGSCNVKSKKRTKHKNISDKRHGAKDKTNPQGGIHEISTSHESNGARSKKSRKQWAKTTKTVLELDMTGQENSSKRNGRHGYSEKNLTEKNIRGFNGIQDETNVESPEYVGNNVTAKLPVTERIANVVHWMESLPPPESGEPTLEPVPYGISEERSNFHKSSGEDIIIKQDDIAQDSASVDGDQKGLKRARG